MRKFFILLASTAALVITGAATKAALYSHPVQVSAATTLEPMTMHYGSMPVQEISDLTFVFSN